MIGSIQTRVKQKEAQLARLAAKGTPEYGDIYAAQPDQIRIKAEQYAVRQEVRAIKLAADTEASSDADAAVAAFSNLSTKKKGNK